METTRLSEYTQRLCHLETKLWKRWLGVQLPYRWNLRRLQPGYALEIGCGIGRNLLHLDGKAVGVDHNPQSVSLAVSRGLTAFTPEQFFLRFKNNPQQFESLILAHVLEHMTESDAFKLIQEYLPFLKSHGKLILICPQEKGFASDSTHVEFVDLPALKELCHKLSYEVDRCYSFPFPRFAGKYFTHNEFIVRGVKK